MSRIVQKKLVVDPADGVTEWRWFVRPDEADNTAWLAEIDAGTLGPDAVTDSPEWPLEDLEGDYDFAVVQADAAGNTSDPATFAAWDAVPLDVTAPPPATGGRIENV